MSTNVKDAPRSSGIPPIDAGTYPARCTAVIDLGLQKTSYQGQEKETPQILLIFEFPTEIIDIDGEQKPRWMSKRYTFSVSERANLRKDLKSWRGRDFTDQELRDFDIKNVINAPCMITTTLAERDNRTYANITAIGKLMKGVDVPDVKDRMHFDLDVPDTWLCFPKLPEWIQATINESITLKNRGVQISKDGKAFSVGTKPEAADGFAEVDFDDSDDLPF